MLRMEREVTALVTDSVLSCETNLMMEYAPKVMRGDKTKGVNAVKVSIYPPGIAG